ncbi:unnamed protein product, partial [Amoebophrya sp. A120]
MIRDSETEDDDVAGRREILQNALLNNPERKNMFQSNEYQFILPTSSPTDIREADTEESPIFLFENPEEHLMRGKGGKRQKFDNNVIKALEGQPDSIERSDPFRR